MINETLGILYSALLSDQKSLEVRNRNVANSDNPDYVKERPVLQNLSYPGGVVVADVDRLSDEILQKQLLTSTSLLKGYEEKKNVYDVIQNYFDDTTDNGLGKYIDNFFNSVLQFLRDPQNEGAKEAFLGNAQNLIDALKNRYNQLTEIQSQTKKKLALDIAQVNKISKELAQVNKNIALLYAKGKSDSNDYKYLLDERDKLLKQLSEYVNIDYNFDNLGRAEVRIFENDSTAAGYITLVFQNGDFNKLTYDSTTNKVVNSDGIEWPISFFKNGEIGAYTTIINDINSIKDGLNNLAQTLVNNTTITLNGSATPVFKGTSVNDLTLNITKSDLDNYDLSSSETDQDTIQQAWDTVRNTYNTFISEISNKYTDYQIKYETELNLNQSLETKYSAEVGVNLDQELAEIMKLQQHYQAISKMIATSTRLVDYILNAVQ